MNEIKVTHPTAGEQTFYCKAKTVERMKKEIRFTYGKMLDNCTIEVINDKVCFLNEDAENLQYNIAMSRVYFIQSQMNLKLVQEHYSKVMADLGVVEQ